MALQSTILPLSLRLRPSHCFTRPRIRPKIYLKSKHDHLQLHQRRNFISPSLISPEVQHISASRTLPYPSLPIYLTIANVANYHSFLPYCVSSNVTHWSKPDEQFQRRWPERAELEVGWGVVREVFASKIYCVPGKVVEAVAGNGVTSVRSEDIPHHSHANVQEQGISGEIFSHLITRWEVSPVAKSGNAKGQNSDDSQQTHVTLSVDVKFVNPMYAAMSRVAAEKVAVTMMEAFEKQVPKALTRMKQEGIS